MRTYLIVPYLLLYSIEFSATWVRAKRVFKFDYVENGALNKEMSFYHIF